MDESDWMTLAEEDFSVCEHWQYTLLAAALRWRRPDWTAFEVTTTSSTTTSDNVLPQMLMILGTDDLEDIGTPSFPG
jgi:hypothetical protein